MQIPLLRITVDIRVHVLQLDFNDLSLPEVTADDTVSLCAHDFLFQTMSKPPVILTKEGVLNKSGILTDIARSQADYLQDLQQCRQVQQFVRF